MEGRLEASKSTARRKLDLRDEDVIVISSDEDDGPSDKRQGSADVGQQKSRRDVDVDGTLLSTGRVKLVEVKGPRDRLSAQQLAWLHVLAPFVSVEVCYVRENAEV